MLNVGSIISGAFALPVRHPLAVALWSLLYAVPGMVSWLLMQPAALAPADGQEMPAADAFRYLGLVFLAQLVLFLIVVALLSAALRLMLRPHEPGLAGLRLGMDELRILGLSLLMTIAVYFGFVIVVLVLALLFAGLATGLGTVGGAAVVGLAVLAVLGLFIWLQVRLSLVFPLTFIRRKIIIGDSWELTRGRFWTLFGGYFAIFLILMVLWILASAVSAAPYLLSLMQSGFDPDAIQALSSAQMSEINAVTVLGWLLGGAAGALGIALFAGATATVVRQLGVHEEQVASTFA